MILKKNKKSTVKPFMVKNHVSIFVNCLIENPAFDSQVRRHLRPEALRPWHSQVLPRPGVKAQLRACRALARSLPCIHAASASPV